MPHGIDQEAEIELPSVKKWDKREKKVQTNTKDEQPSKPEPEPRIWRGIFSPTYQQKILFSQKVKIQTDKIPRLKPHITIDRRTQTRAEDE